MSHDTHGTVYYACGCVARDCGCFHHLPDQFLSEPCGAHVKFFAARERVLDRYAELFHALVDAEAQADRERLLSEVTD